MVNRTLALFLVSSCLSTSVTATADVNRGVYAHLQIAWQWESRGTSIDAQLAAIHSAQFGLGVPGDSIVVVYNAGMSEFSATRYADLHDGVRDMRTIHVQAHGLAPYTTPGGFEHTQFGFGVQWCQNESYSYQLMDILRQQYPQALPTSSCLDTVLAQDIVYPYEEYWPIVLTEDGIAALAAQYQQPERIVLGHYCFSEDTRAAWGVDESSGPGTSTMLSYEGEASMWDSGPNLLNVCGVLGCTSHILDDYLPDFATIDTYCGVLLAGTECKLSGNLDNAIDAHGSCNSPSGRWFNVSAHNGMVRMAYIGEEACSEYVVVADGDTIGAVAGRGTSGYGRLRCYSVPAAVGFVSFVCIEMDDCGKTTSSDPFTWQSESGEWEVVESMDDMLMEDIYALDFPFPESGPWGPGDPRWEWVAARNSWASSCEADTVEHGAWTEVTTQGTREHPGAADAVVYIHNSLSDAIWDLHYLMVEDFPDLAVLYCYGCGAAADIRLLLEETIAWNEHYNTHGYGTNFPVDPGPTLIVVGDDDTIEMPAIPDSYNHACQESYCYSFNLLGDVNEDRRVDCPVQVIPAKDCFEASSACFYAWEWNHGENVETTGRGLFLLDDWHGDAVTGYQCPAMTPMMERIRDVYFAGQPMLDPGVLLKPSTFYSGPNPPPTITPLIVAGQEAFRQGVRDVWAWGESTVFSDITHFFNRRSFLENGGLDRNQVIMVFAPCCHTGAVHKEYSTSQGPMKSVVRHVLFNDAGATRAAGFLGQLNADWDKNHLRFARVFRNELGNASEGMRFADIVHAAVRTYQEQYPLYGVGVVWYGAPTRLRGTFLPSTSVGEEAASCAEACKLWTCLVAGFPEIHFELAEEGEVELDIYDVSGRRVSAIKHGHMEPGAYTYTWFLRDCDGHPVRNGMYFARIKVSGAEPVGKSARVVVVR